MTSSDDGGQSPNGLNGNNDAAVSAYERLMGLKDSSVTVSAAGASDGAASPRDNDAAVQSTEALSWRLMEFRAWLSDEANVQVHSALCIVNGEATDGTKNAPVLVYDRATEQQSTQSGGTAGATTASSSSNTGERVGKVDWRGDQALYDRTMGCQVRAAREMRKDEVMMTMPRSAMITPDLVASSDAGKAIIACCRTSSNDVRVEGGDGTECDFWDVFENTSICESRCSKKIASNSGPQLLVKILQERKKAEAAYKKRIEEQKRSMVDGKPQLKYALLEPGKVSTRAPLLAFLIHQRFSELPRPPVASDSDDSIEQFQRVEDNDDGNALKFARQVQRPPGAPDSFAPYARTLPSSISLPLCWNRSELALLACSAPGFTPLLEVAARTMQLSSEFISLLESGLLERFPETFPDGLITWERWVWAAAVLASRALPVTTYITAGLKDASEFKPAEPLEFQSPPAVWNELGVLVPLLDMLNHEVEANQVTWEPEKSGDEMEEEGEQSADSSHPPRAILHKKVRKGSELYTCYGILSNTNLMLQYGFAQLSNPSDEVKLGWGLHDAIGHLDPPSDYKSPIEDETFRRFLVFESSNEEDVKRWWTEDRLKLLETEAFSSSKDGFMDSLKSGKKMTACAYRDGTYHPILLTAIVVATMPKIELQKFKSSKKEKIILSSRHQQVLRSYLAFLFSRKLEKLLQNISSGLKDHYATAKLWTSLSKGGLSYKPEEDEAGEWVGWQAFFDSHAYPSSMEVEKHYYAMGADSCVLTLYDGQLKTLQASLDGVCDDEKFQRGVLKQLEDLSFGLSTGDKDETSSGQGNGTGSSPEGKKSPRNRKRNRQKSTTVSNNSIVDRPKALKLHVGNLAFTTTPSEMYDYFANIYGKDQILECHIPVERDNGKSRGFGFVTMPEALAEDVLRSNRKFEISGRIVKLAKSNSAGTASSSRGRGSGPPPPPPSDRCPNCGYRPKYCTCGPRGGWGGPPPPPNYGPPPDYRRGDRDYSYYGSGGGDWPRYRDGPPLPPPPRPDYYDDEDRDRYGRPYDRDRSRYPSSRYEDDRYYDDDYDRGSRRRSRDRSGSRGRYDRSSSRDRDRGSSGRKRSRSRSASRGQERSREKSRKKKSKRRSTRSPRSPRSHSPSPMDARK